jgi:hypothetical protein
MVSNSSLAAASLFSVVISFGFATAFSAAAAAAFFRSLLSTAGLVASTSPILVHETSGSSQAEHQPVVVVAVTSIADWS